MQIMPAWMGPLMLVVGVLIGFLFGKLNSLKIALTAQQQLQEQQQAQQQAQRTQQVVHVDSNRAAWDDFETTEAHSAGRGVGSSSTLVAGGARRSVGPRSDARGDVLPLEADSVPTQ